MTKPEDIRFNDPITDLLFTALRQARAAHRALAHDMPLLLPHTSRPFAASIARRCNAEQVFDAAFARDLDALISELEDQVATETHVDGHCDPDTGFSWEDLHRTQSGEALDRAATALRKLRATLDAVADAKTAEEMRCQF